MVATVASIDTPVRILAVCTGNVCRSPYAQAVLGAWLDEVAPGAARVTSCGTGVNPRITVPDVVHELAAGAGADLDGFASRALTPPIVRDADLVLTATAAHRVKVLDELPDAVNRTFRLLEFAQLSSANPPPAPLASRGDWQDHVARIARLRGSTSGGAALDLEDPFGRGHDAYEAMAASIDPALKQIVALAGAR